jgi:pimeloyl-ACP methyl ester carboxylesterase
MYRSGMTTIVLVHGAFHGPWCFEPLIAELAGRGITCVAPELPLTNLADDAAAVHAALDACKGPVALLGHSYGGAVITVAGVHLAVEQLVYLAAMAPDTGESANGGRVEIDEAFIAAIRPTKDGRISIDPDRAVALFYPDADPNAAAAFAGRLRPGHVGGAEAIVELAAWRVQPTTYIVCADDPIVVPSSQRALAARIGGDVLEMPGDHSPFLARPVELAELLVDICN